MPEIPAPELVTTEGIAVEVAPRPPFWVEGVTRIAQYIPGWKNKDISATLIKAIHGSAWTLIGYSASQLVRLATTLLLARLLLGPKEFGLIALVNVFLGGLEMLSDLAIGMDVVQHRRGDDPAFINTAFLIQFGRGFLLWGAATALAYPFAVFYHQPQVFWLAVVGAASTGLRGLTSGSVWTMTRHLQIRKLTLLTLAGDAVGLLVSIGWAAVSPTAWALVVGKIASTLVFVVATHVVAEHPVSTLWDAKAARDILAFGGGMLISSSTYFLTGEGERLVVGKFVNLVELGCFSLALGIATAITKGLQQVIGQVFFPLMAQQVRKDPEQAARKYQRVRLLVLLVSAVLIIGFLGGSRWVVKLLLNPKYESAGWMLQLLGVRGCLELFTAAATSMLFTVGTSKYSVAGNIGKMLFLAGGLAIAFSHFGFRQALWVLAISPIAAYAPLLVGLRSHFPSVLRTEMASFAMLCAITAAMVGMVHLTL